MSQDEEQEAGENCTVRSSIIFNLYQIFRSTNEGE
jgi:hypothetical protein